MGHWDQSRHSAEANSQCPMVGHCEFTSALCSMTYLAFSWLTALTNQVIRLVGHSQFTSAWCPELRGEKHRDESDTPWILYAHLYLVNLFRYQFFVLKLNLATLCLKFFLFSCDGNLGFTYGKLRMNYLVVKICQLYRMSKIYSAKKQNFKY